MPNLIHHLWPQWVKSDAFIQKISENYCLGNGVKPSEKCSELPTWTAFVEAVDHSLSEGLAVSRLIPTTANGRRLRTPSSRDREILGRRIRLARLMAREHQKTLQVRMGYGSRSGMLSKIEFGHESINPESLIKLSSELNIAVSWFYSLHILAPLGEFDICISKLYLEKIADGKILSTGKTAAWKSPDWMNPFIAWSLYGPKKGMGSGTRSILRGSRSSPLNDNDISQKKSVTENDVRP